MNEFVPLSGINSFIRSISKQQTTINNQNWRLLAPGRIWKMFGFIQTVFYWVSNKGSWIFWSFIWPFILAFPFRGFNKLEESIGWRAYPYTAFLIGMWGCAWLIMSKPEKLDKAWKKVDGWSDKLMFILRPDQTKFGKPIFGFTPSKTTIIKHIPFIKGVPVGKLLLLFYYLFPLVIAFFTGLFSSNGSCFDAFDMRYIWPSVFFFGVIFAIIKLPITRVILQICAANFITSPHLAKLYFGPEADTASTSFLLVRAGIASIALILYLVWKQVLRSPEQKAADAAIIAEKGFVLGYLYLFFQDQIEFVFPPNRGQKCTACGKRHGKNEQFCKSCGTPLPRAPWKCSKCGKMHEWNIEFCPEDGTPKPVIVSDIKPLERCPGCDLIKLGERYCVNCGYDKVTKTQFKPGTNPDDEPDDGSDTSRSLKETTEEALTASNLSDKTAGNLKL